MILRTRSRLSQDLRSRRLGEPRRFVIGESVGHLAQRLEHLAYTEGVGGSRPSVPSPSQFLIALFHNPAIDIAEHVGMESVRGRVRVYAHVKPSRIEEAEIALG